MTQDTGSSSEPARKNVAAAGGSDGVPPAAAANRSIWDEPVAKQSDRGPQRSRRHKHQRTTPLAMWAFLLIQAAFLAVLIWGTAASSSIDCSQSASEYECAQQNDLAAGLAALGIISWWVVADLVLLACYGIWKLSDPSRAR